MNAPIITVATAEAARDTGMSIADWAKALGVSHGVVTGRLQRLGVRWASTAPKCPQGHLRAGNSTMLRGQLRCTICDARRAQLSRGAS